MSTITTLHTGDMQFETKIGQHTLVMDVPADMGGQDRGPMPPQFFIASLGGCVAAVVSHYCNQNGIDITGLRVDVSFDKADNPSRLDNIKIYVMIPNADYHSREAAIARVADHCPVHETMKHFTGLDITIVDSLETV